MELLLLGLVQPCVDHLAELAGMVVVDVHLIVFPPPKITTARRWDISLGRMIALIIISILMTPSDYQLSFQIKHRIR